MFDRRMREVSTGTGSVGLSVMEHHCQALILENDQMDLWKCRWKQLPSDFSYQTFCRTTALNLCTLIISTSRPSMATPDAAVMSSGRAVLKRQFVWIMHVGWHGLLWNSSCCRHLLVFTGIAGGGRGGGWIFDSGTSGRKYLIRNCCDNTVTWESFSEVVNGTKERKKSETAAWSFSQYVCLKRPAVTLSEAFQLCLSPFTLNWAGCQVTDFCEKKKISAFTAFHSYELASFFILSWIWLPTCSGSILSVQVSVGGWLMRGENPEDGGFSPTLSATRPSSPPLSLRPRETRPAPCTSRGHIFQQQFYEGIFLLFKM